MTNSIELKSIGELLGMNFFIPDYQRGYRWTASQVELLLDDLEEYHLKEDNNKEAFYCLQPLVVKPKINEQEVLNKIKEKDKLDDVKEVLASQDRFEVIDGQQRLTTLFLILKYLNKKSYQIEYDTRKDSKGFLENIQNRTKVESKENVDYYHIYHAYEGIDEWFDERKKLDKKIFLQTILEKTKFIWYNAENEDFIKVFTRLNIGKISLTNAELIKALFLNKSNFGKNYNEQVALQQKEIALEWDQIEYTLQNDEFWLFIHGKGYQKPTRIDFIFDLMVDKDALQLDDKVIKKLPNDEYRTFQYFYKYFQQEKEKRSLDIVELWQSVKQYFQIFKEWYNDLEYYHYVGYLVETGSSEIIRKLITTWKENDKMNFLESLKGYIRKRIQKNGINNLNRIYDIGLKEDDKIIKKTECKPLLLLHNIQTVINQNQELAKEGKYKLPVFYKFPFHLYKLEKWDVEHIASSTDNELDKKKDQDEWLKHIYNYLSKKEIDETNVEERIKNFINEESEIKAEAFDVLQNEIVGLLSMNYDEIWQSPNDKNKIWNFTLLDSSTNRAYGNDIFPVKRRKIIAKDQGQKVRFGENFEIKFEKGKEIAFVPPVTKNIFLKYYSPASANSEAWTIKDAKHYKDNIENTLKEFLKDDTND